MRSFGAALRLFWPTLLFNCLSPTSCCARTGSRNVTEVAEGVWNVTLEEPLNALPAMTPPPTTTTPAPVGGDGGEGGIGGGIGVEGGGGPRSQLYGCRYATSRR